MRGFRISRYLYSVKAAVHTATDDDRCIDSFVRCVTACTFLNALEMHGKSFRTVGAEVDSEAASDERGALSSSGRRKASDEEVCRSARHHISEAFEIVSYPSQ